MTLAELGMSSVPSLLAVPHITRSIDEQGRAQAEWLDKARARFLDEFLWHCGALREARRDGVPY